MSSRIYDVSGLGKIATFVTAQKDAATQGSLAKDLKPTGTGFLDVVKDYSWTNSKSREEVPYIRLIEYKCNETVIKKQYGFYTNLTADKFNVNQKSTEVLDIYQEIFPKDEPSGWSYKLPYFNETGFELSTPPWTQLDSIGDALKSMASSASNGLNAIGFKKAGGVIDLFTGAAQVAGAGADIALGWQYPSVGIQDRPKIFAGHSERQITISFPLYNTFEDYHWPQNRDLIYILMSQNLYNKRNLITGMPPVFYDIYVPGQYYCYAASMTNVVVKNLGNTRLMENGKFIVPDAYQITLTLTELTMPSKNQFEAMTSGAAAKEVNVK